jgi:(S)-2-hydroxyglutarate dehydrogenase
MRAPPHRNSVQTTDFLVIGGGIVGLTIAHELRRRYPDQRVSLIEKEAGLGEHASGRNSGVIHAGFYYSADSLKARLTRQGNIRLTEYCVANRLQIRRCGKLVVATRAGDLAGLDELHRRAQRNEVPVEMISEADAAQIEPRARTVERALWSPTTSSVDPHEVLSSLAADAERDGVTVRRGVAYRRRIDRGEVATSEGIVKAGYVVNAAGLYADRIARDFGFSERYRILPFKGVYLYGDERESLRTNVYPVPDLANPFLGVHFTVTASGRSKIGPTAIPAFWREQYSGIGRFSLSEFLEIAVRESLLLLRNDFGFRRLAAAEVAKYRRARLVALASALVPDVDANRYATWGRSGIRAQLLDIRERRLEMDFRVEGDSRSMHVLNAVSPAFTCALPFAEHVADLVASA